MSILTLAVAVLVTAAVAAPAFAIFPQLQTKLSGPAIAGVTPEGDAKLDQSRQPSPAGSRSASRTSTSPTERG
jgi:hypothetical protein